MKRSRDASERDPADRTREPSSQTAAEDQDIDTILADSFPASDPPPWTLGLPLPAADAGRTADRSRRSRSR